MNRPAPTLRRQSQMPVRVNKYAATCESCHGRVEAEQGFLSLEDSQWVVRHPAGRCGVTEPVAAPPSRPTIVKVPDGRYTIQFADGTYKTLKVAVQPDDADFMPGRQVISYLSGSNNDSDYTRFAHFLENGTVVVWQKHQATESLREALKVLIASPQAAALAYAEESGCCARCGRTLTVPASLHAGYGPDCITKVSW